MTNKLFVYQNLEKLASLVLPMQSQQNIHGILCAVDSRSKNMWQLLVLIGVISLFLLRNERYKWIIILAKTYRRDIRLALAYARLNLLLWLWEKQNKTVPGLFSDLAKKHPHKVAIFFEDDIWTFAQVEDFSNKIGRYFKNQGFQKGDSIALLMESRPEYICIWLGLAKIGVVTALINTNLVSGPLLYSINVPKSKGVIFGSNHTEPIKNVTESLKSMQLYQFHEIEKETKEVLTNCVNLRHELELVSSDPVKCDVETSIRDPLLHIYTSGTTGLPKAALVTNNRYMFTAIGINSAVRFRSNDNLYDPLPLYHSAGGMLGAGQTLMMGVTLTIRKKFSASNYWKDCAKYRCSHAQYIGEMCRYILAAPNQENVKHSVRGIFGNGLRPQIWKTFAEKFNIQEVYEFYGATEGISNIVNVDNTVGGVGAVPRYLRWVYPVTLIKCNDTTGAPIRDENGHCIECGINEPGLVIGKINQKKAVFSFKGYSDEDATEKKVLQNVFTTGDLYFNSGDILIADELGNFYFKDRTGDTFRWKGENVSTAEVEAVISNVVQLNDAVVYGVEIPETEGKAGMVAIVDTAKNLDLDLLTKGLSSNLPSYAIPIFLRIMDSVELTGTYKLKKVELQAEGYDINKVTDKLYFYNSKLKKYEILTQDVYEQILSGKLSL